MSIVIRKTCSNVGRGFKGSYLKLISAASSTVKKKRMKNKFTIAVEGNIGCGKTAFLNHFADAENVQVHQEPVDKWRNIKGHNGLEAMYRDPYRWSLTFQTYVQLTMVQQHSMEQTEANKLIERSIYSAKYCFVENLHNSKKMPDLEYIILTEWFDWILANVDCSLDLIVYLRTKPETVFNRIKERCRKEEESISLEYLENLHQLHEDWLMHKKCPTPAPVLVLDADASLEEMKEKYEHHRDNILRGGTRS